MKNIQSPTVLLVTALASGLGSIAQAADTVETWDSGATDVDFYLGVDGITADGGGSFGDIMLGYGILDGFSVYFGTTMEGDETLSNGETSLYFGIFGTPINTDHFDLDLFLNVSMGGPSLDTPELGPAIELNFDHSPDLQTWGVYLRAQLPVHGRETGALPMVEHESTAASYHVASSLGFYRTLAPGHQLLIEYDMDFHPADDRMEARTVEVGGLALGYNVAVNDTLELITQLFADLPQSGETTEFGVMAGFIATLPQGSR